MTDRAVPFTDTWSELFEPVMTVDAVVAAPVRRAATDDWVTSSVYLPAVTASANDAVVTPIRFAVFDTASRAELVTCAEAEVTADDDRRLCDAASWSTVKLVVLGAAVAPTTAETALEFDTLEARRFTPLVTRPLAAVRSESRVLRNRPIASLFSFTSAWRAFILSPGNRSTPINPETMDDTSMPPALNPTALLDDTTHLLRSRHREISRP